MTLYELTDLYATFSIMASASHYTPGLCCFNS